MADTSNRRIERELVPAEVRPRTSESGLVLPIISGPPSALSPLAGRRILITTEQPLSGERSLAEDLAFQDRLALAAHLAALDAEVVLAPVGAPFTPDDLRVFARTPGLSTVPGPAVPRPMDDAGDAAAALSSAAAQTRAGALLLHDPALAAARRDPLPTVVLCERSPLVEWRARHGEAPAPKNVRDGAALERLGLHAADRVIAASRALAAELVALHGLSLPPAVAPPVFRRPESHERPGAAAGFILAGSTSPEPGAVVTLDRAAAQICGQALILDAGRDAGHGSAGPCLAHAHALAAMPIRPAESLLLRACAFHCLGSAAGFDRLVWRAASAGCALILPETSGHREYWHSAAQFTPPGDAGALAAALRRMLEDDDHRRRLAAAALRRARALATGPAAATLQKALAAALDASPLTAALQAP